MRRLSSFIAALIVVAFIVEVLPGSAATDIILRHGSGTVGYRSNPTAPLITVTGEQTVADNAYASTGPSSLGIIVFPDSSLVRLGANSEVQIGAFKQAEQGGGSTIKVGSRGGTMRFQVRHPVGARSNYNFDTSIMNIAVRGTTALLADGPEGDVLACLQCGAGDVVVTVGGNQYALLTAQTLIATPDGRVRVMASSDSELAQFRGTGLSTTLGPDDGYGSAGAAAPQPGVLIGVAAAVIAGVVAIASSNHSSSSNTPSGTPTATPTPVPSGYGAVILTPSSISLSSANKTAQVTASQSGNTTNQFIPSTPQVVCPSGGSATVQQAGASNAFTVTWVAAPSTQNCTAQINGLGGVSANLQITLSP